MAAFKKSSIPRQSSYNSLYLNPLNDLKHNRSCSEGGRNTFGFHLSRDAVTIPDDNNNKENAVPNIFSGNNRENSVPNKKEKPFSENIETPKVSSSSHMPKKFIDFKCPSTSSALKPSSLQLCMQVNDPDSNFRSKLWDPIPAKKENISNSANIWDYSDSEAAPASSWSALPNRSLLYRHLPLDIGRCTCVIVKENLPDGLDGGVLYSLYTNDMEGEFIQDSQAIDDGCDVIQVSEAGALIEYQIHEDPDDPTVGMIFNSRQELEGMKISHSVRKIVETILRKQEGLRLGVGDAEAIRNYFVKMQDKNSSFFYVIDFDDDSRIRNLFWADARSRAAYESFGDVVTFDTTYLTNKYDMPFAPFVGVNHHGQSVLLGCGLLSNEDTKTFVWLFESWLACMSNCPPKAIITDQCKAMKSAVEVVFPEARHRWCLWHILKKVPEKFNKHSEYERISFALHNVVYDSYTKDEYEERWLRMIDKFDLSKNEWLDGLYKERERWVPAFVKDTFWAGMSTTQRSESMNAFFDNYVNSKTTLKQFVEQYDNALRNKFEKEKLADFKSFNSMYDCITLYDIEKQFQCVYTNAKFKEFQGQLKNMLYCHPSLLKVEGSICTYEVIEDVKLVEKWKRVVFVVYFNKVECEVQCTCRLFDFRGILCSHSLKVLTQNNVAYIPSRYILSRWRKDLKREYNFLKTNYGNECILPNVLRYEVAKLASDFEDKCNIVLDSIQELKLKVLNVESKCESNQVALVGSPKVAGEKMRSPLTVRRKGRPPSKGKMSKAEVLNVESKCESTQVALVGSPKGSPKVVGEKVCSPLAVRRKGRPPSKRKMSKADQAIQKCKERKKKDSSRGKPDVTPTSCPQLPSFPSQDLTISRPEDMHEDN